MTKKDYIAIARAIRHAAEHPQFWYVTSPSNESEYVQGAKAVACALSVDLQRDHPRFDRARFLAACGVSREANPSEACGVQS